MKHGNDCHACLIFLIFSLMFDLEIIFMFLKVVQKQAKEWVGAATFCHVHCLSMQGDCIDCVTAGTVKCN